MDYKGVLSVLVQPEGGPLLPATSIYSEVE